MARGVALSELISQVRDELRRANSPSASPDDTASIRQTINHVYYILGMTNDWPFLNTLFDGITLQAGSRYYDFPEGLDPDRVIEAKVYWSSFYTDIERGISLADYNSYNPNLNERSAPILKWDVKFTGTKEQIEVWPLPDSTSQVLQFYGTQALPPLVNNTDKCKLESNIIVLYAAAELAPKDSADKDAKLELAKEGLRLIKLRGNSAAGATYRLGVGHEPEKKVHPRAIVRIGG